MSGREGIRGCSLQGRWAASLHGLCDDPNVNQCYDILLWLCEHEQMAACAL